MRAAAAFVLSLTLVPALVAIVIRGKVTERENVAVRAVKRIYGPVLELGLRARWVVVPLAVAVFGLSAWLFTRMGSEFVPTLDEKDIAMHAMRIPSTGITQSQFMQSEVERAVSKIPEVAFVFSKTGTAEVASDPMPPNVSDTFIIFKPSSEWRSEAELDALIEERQRVMAAGGSHEDAHAGHADEEGEPELKLEGHKGKLVQLIQLTVGDVPGNNYEFTQPIQMRFNELISGVRGDELRGGDAYRIGERTVHMYDANGQPAITYVDANQIGYVFTSERLSAQELLALVATSDIVGHAQQQLR
jgi:cobalt-zinc-cadmium resistance protein CzcA